MKRFECFRCHRKFELEVRFLLERPDGSKSIIDHAHSMSQNSEIQCVCGAEVK